MELSTIDIAVFVLFIALVIGVSIVASGKESTGEDYFLAGRRLTWWLIGTSLIASNISTEHFIGMGGEGFSMGLAIASFEWIAAIVLVVVALYLLPKFLRSGIYTIPQFFEYRFDATTRSIMAFYLMLVYVLAGMAGVLYAGALATEQLLGLPLEYGVWLLGILAGGYTIYGGLAAVVWSDLIQGAALLLGGLLVTILGLQRVGGLEAFLAANEAKLHVALPSDHPTMPWTILLLGIWIPNLFYWGLNQFITQRALAAKNLAEGQRGILFAAFLKLLIPFIIVFPGIIAWQLYGSEISDKDQAYTHLIANILPKGLRGLMFAALFGAMMSSLDSMLNSASTIFTIDLYKRHWSRSEISPTHLVKIGRIVTTLLAVFACLIALAIAQLDGQGVYKYMQMVWGFISPPICAVFVVGMVSQRVPAMAASVGLAVGPFLYGLQLWLLSPELGGSGTMSYINVMALTALEVAAIMVVIGVARPRDGATTFPDTKEVDMTASRSANVVGVAIVAMTVALYCYFF